MSAPVASPVEKILENVASAFAVVALAIAVWVLSQYALHAWPQMIARGYSPANPAGTVLAFFVGSAVLSRVSMSRGHGGAAVGKMLAAIVFVLASIKVIGAVQGVDVVFDRLLFASQVNGPQPIRMALNNAITFELLGASLLLQFFDRFPKIADFLALCGFLIVFDGTVGRLFGEAAWTSFGWERAISLPGAVTLILLTLAVFLSRPKKGVTAILADEGTAGAAARRLLPAAFVTPFVVGLLFFSNPNAVHLARATIASAVAFCAILAISIRKLLQIDRQRLNALREVSERSAKDHALMESIGDGVFAVDQKWLIAFWNKGAERITGYSAAEAVGRPLRDVLVIRNAATREENMGVIDQALGLGKIASLKGENYIVAKDGREVPIGDSAAPVPGADGMSSSGAIVVFRDVSDEKKLAKLRQDFLFRTIHDLRSPANIINLLVQDFYESKSDIKDHPDVVKGMRTINELNDRMRRLVEDLLQVAKGTDEASSLQIQPVEVVPLAQAILEQQAAAANERHMRLEMLPSDASVTVMADPSAVTEVLDNFVGNAIKYGKAAGVIRVSCEVVDGVCKMTVWDDGMGIAPENIPPIFDPYFRVPNTGKPGTGLGLFIVRQLVEKMGGQVQCASELGKWTAFSFTLPLVKRGNKV